MNIIGLHDFGDGPQLACRTIPGGEWRRVTAAYKGTEEGTKLVWTAPEGPLTKESFKQLAEELTGHKVKEVAE